MGGRIWQEVSHLFLSALLSPSLARNMRTGGAGPLFSLFHYLSFPSPSRPVRRKTHAVSAILYNIRHCDKNTIKQFRGKTKFGDILSSLSFPAHNNAPSSPRDIGLGEQQNNLLTFVGREKNKGEWCGIHQIKAKNNIFSPE